MRLTLFKMMLFGNGKDDYILIYIIQITHTHKHLYRYIYFFFCLRTEFSYKSLGNLVLRTQKKHMRVCARVFPWQLKIIDHILRYASPLSLKRTEIEMKWKSMCSYSMNYSRCTSAASAHLRVENLSNILKFQIF